MATNAPVRATREDIYYAYRLLLGREPDEGGRNACLRLIEDPSITPVVLARQVLASHEFAALNPESVFIEVALEGFTLFVWSDDRDVGLHIRQEGHYEPHVTAAVREFLRPGHVVVDVGANIGYFSNLAASIVGRDGFVAAVEPLDKNRQALFRSLSRNDFNNVRVHACAAGDRTGTISIITDRGTSSGQPLGATASNPAALFAPMERLDDITANLSRIDLVKFDIEGFELLAWRGFKQNLERHRPVVLTEFHPYGMRTYVGVDPLDYLAELFAFGRAVFVLSPDGARTPCAAASDVMRQWERVNEAAKSSDGRVHLDLLILPRE